MKNLILLYFLAIISLGIQKNVSANSTTNGTVRIVELNYTYNTVGEALDYLKSNPQTQDLTIKLSFTDYNNEIGELSTNGIEMNGYHLTIKGIGSSTPSVIKLNSNTAHVLKNSLSNFTLQDIVLQGADPLDITGSLFFQDKNSQNINLVNVQFNGGYCGMRAANYVKDIYLKDISSQNVTHGTLRLGCGDFITSRKDTMVWERLRADFDVENITIDGLTMISPDGNTDVPGTSKKYNGFLLLKKIYNLKVKNVRSINGNGGSGLIIEDSKKVCLESIQLDDFGYNQFAAAGISISKTSEVLISNTLLKTRDSDSEIHILYHLNIVHGLKFCHNTAIAVKPYDKVFYGQQISEIEYFKANVFHSLEAPVEIHFRTIDQYNASISLDWQQDNFNVYVSHDKYYSLLRLKNIDNDEYDIRHDGAAFGTASRLEYSEYQNLLNRGRKNAYAFPPSKIKYTNADSYYLNNSSLGRNLVTELICPFDLNNDSRSLPSDAGAFDADSQANISIEETMVSNTIEAIYPNPATTDINIQLGKKVREGVVTIYDNVGHTLMAFGINQVSEFSTPIDLNSGHYILSITENGNTTNRSFLVH